MSGELKQLTHDVQELAGLPADKRDGTWNVETARALIKKLFGMGLSLAEPSKPAVESSSAQ